MKTSFMKESYLEAEIEVVTFGREDVITTSSGGSGPEYIGPYIPIDDGE
ncbi:MAG: hypothetical protein IKD91_00900 [Clostridiales bacterium]|nr:hypothetical protein [Clostridiales bacterium]